MSPLLLPSLLCLLLLSTGCGGDAPPLVGESADGRSVPSAGSPATPRSSPPASAQASPPPTSQPTPAGTAAEERAGGDRKQEPPFPAARADASQLHLLTASTLPRVAGWGWTVRSTEPEKSRPVGACQEAALVDIGAVRAVRRVFSGPDASGAAAAQVVARFADAKSAWRAHEVLRAWHDDCAKRLGAASTDVSPMQEVALTAGDGGHYRTSHGNRRRRLAAGLGIVRVGRWLSVVELSAVDHDHPIGRQPSRRAVRRIAATFA